MATNYHTPLTVGAPANASTVNAPLAQLDSAIAGLATNTALLDYVLSTGGPITQANGAASAAQKVVTVDSTTGFLGGCFVEYALATGVIERNTVATVDSGTQITLGTNIGTGGIANNALIAVIPAGFYNTKVSVYNVLDYGAVGDGVADDTAALQAAIDAMEGAGGGVVVLPADMIFLVTGGLTMTAGCLRGGGLTSVIRATSQSGPVLDLDSYYAGDFQWGNDIGNFSIEGDNAADATKANCGIRLQDTSGITGLTNVRLHDISISKTGGPALYVGTGTDICDFHNITLYRPIGANTNDVPYMHLVGIVNGNTFTNITCRSLVTTADGATAVIHIDDNGTDAPTQNTFMNLRTEYCHIPENGSLILCEGYANTFIGTTDFDSATTTNDTTNTALLRFTVPAATRGGGNVVLGNQKGWVGAGSDAYIKYGIIIDADGNFVNVGAGPYDGHILLKSGADNNFVLIGGRTGIGGSYAGLVTDSSGTTTNTIINAAERKWYLGGTQIYAKNTDETTTAQFVSVGTDNVKWFSGILTSTTPDDERFYVADVGGSIKICNPYYNIQFAAGGETAQVALTDTGRLGIGEVAAPAAKLHVDQSSTSGAVPVLTVDQADVSEEFIRFIGTSTTDASQSLVDAADMEDPGAIVGWLKIYVQDDQGTNGIADGAYYVPFYAAPTHSA